MFAGEKRCPVVDVDIRPTPRPPLLANGGLIAQDMEPEYIAVTENGNTAYVTLQVGDRGASFKEILPGRPRDKCCTYIWSNHAAARG